MKTAGCGTYHEYTYTQNYRIKCYKTFYKKQYHIFSLHIKNSSIELKGCACRNFLKDGLNFALSFLRIFTLGGKMSKIFMPAENVLF
jgi:IS1 family transposase